MENYLKVTEGIKRLTDVLAPFVCQHLRGKHGSAWWRDGVYNALHDNRDLPETGTDDVLMGSLDAARCLTLISSVHWDDIFRKVVSREQRSYMRELVEHRNQWAHQGKGDLKKEDAHRVLDTVARVLEPMDSEATERVRELAREVLYGAAAAVGAGAVAVEPEAETAEPAEPAATDAAPVAPPEPVTPAKRSKLPSWREVVRPHPDVAEGRYRQAEFAVDLSQVARGAAVAEYQDPVEFFARTYITEGMRDLLTQAVLRVSGRGGEPVIQVKTSFGGGKTHSMLALLHLLQGRVAYSKLPGAADVVREAGVTELPGTRVVVLVGTALNPSKMRRPPTFPGITIRTLWGEMAAQIAEQAGDQKLYDLVKDADLRSVSPGSETLRELFDAGGPCVVLIDELVAYARKLYGVDGLPAGSFDNVLTFVQELTEAARQSRNSMVIASIPESDIEIGGDAGREALARIGHTFERMEAIWKPVGAEEGFEIVRRRLFLDIKDTPSRDDVCRAFSRMYAEGGAEFPVEAKEAAYAERMKRCYPIHPEVFDRLYNEWASMERFQKTRGVLRLMASVIHELWVRKDPGLLIMPGSIPIDAIAVREELLRHLPDGWSPVVESDVDGGRSTPKRLDAGNVRLGEYCAARRVARTVFLGSAPSVKEQNVRGIENTRIRLGVAEPDDQVAVYNDALSRLRDKLAFLYNSGSRYWYDTRPNLRRTMEDRAQQVTEEAIDMEMDRRLKAIRDRADFAGVHICPTGSSDVGDDQRVRLVVLSHRHPHKANQADTAAVAAAADILNNRGSGPRLNRNMLVFVAPDKDLLPVLVSEIRKYLAWKSILADAEALNLDAHQKTEANSSHLRSDGTVALRVQEAFIWLLVPTRQPEDKATSFDVVRLSATKDGCVIEAAKRLRTSGQLITKWSPDLLQMELDQWFWADTDDVNTQKVWDSLAQYVYLSRLKDVDVFLEAVRDGVRSGKWGYAHSKAEDGTYAGLQLGDASGSLYVNATSLLVKPDVARKQIEAEKGAIAIPSGENAGESGPLFVSGGVAGATAFTPTESQSAAARIKRRFHGSVDLGDRVGAAAARIADEVLSHLQGLPKARVKVTMEIDADIPDGAPDHVIRTVTENARQLKFTDQGFEEE